MKKLYVGNIPYSMTEEQLGDLFRPHGEVSSLNIVKDAASGRSKGFGFVEIADEAAAPAIAAVNGIEFDGRTLRVDEARPQAAPREGGPRRGGPGRGGPGRGPRGNGGPRRDSFGGDRRGGGGGGGNRFDRRPRSRED